MVQCWLCCAAMYPKSSCFLGHVMKMLNMWVLGPITKHLVSFQLHSYSPGKRLWDMFFTQSCSLQSHGHSLLGAQCCSVCWFFRAVFFCMFTGDTPIPAAEVLIDLKGEPNKCSVQVFLCSHFFVESAKRRKSLKARTSPRKRTLNVTYSDSSPKKMLVSMYEKRVYMRCGLVYSI